MKKELNKRYFFENFYVRFLICLLIPLFILGVYICLLTTKSVKDEIRGEMSQNVQSCVELVNMELNSIVEKTEFMVSNTSFIDKIIESKESDINEKVVLDMELKTFIGSMDGVFSESVSPVMFYLDSSYRSRYIDSISNLEISENNKKHIESGTYGIWWDDEVYKDEQSGELYLVYYRNIIKYPKNVGVIKGNISLDIITNIAQKSIEPAGGVLVYKDKSGNVKETIGNENVLSKKYISISKELINKHTIEYCVPESLLKVKLYERIFYIVFFLISILIASAASAHVIFKNITKRLNTFIENLKNKLLIKNNDELPRGDDIAMIEQKFEKLLSEVELLHEQTLEMQLRQNTSEIEVLQAKINPHFLYNSLSAIKWKATKNGEEDICKLIDELTRYYRNTLSISENVITISKEKEIIENYLFITKLSYGCDFDYEFNIEEQCESCYILKMLIQPIVENAFLHGIQGLEDRKIIIRAFKDNQALCITIEDNGYGIPKERLEEVNAEKNVVGKHYGIKNIKERIKLFYGKEYGISIESRYKKGTKVTMLLPCKYEKE